LKTNIRAAAAAMVLAAALFICGSSRAADANPPAKISVATIDVSRVMNEAKPISTLQTEFKEKRTDQQKQLDNLYAGRLLNDQERTELEKLQSQKSPTPAQTTRIAELTKLSDTREQELSRLSRLEKPTDEDRARATELSNWLDKQNQRAAQLRDQLDQSAQQQLGDLNKRAMDMVMNAVRALAQEKGIGMVVDRQAVLFATDDLDLTDLVLQRLNAAAPKNGGASASDAAGSRPNAKAPAQSGKK
jgi:Skp family chaperone for outer membrane proteins